MGLIVATKAFFKLLFNRELSQSFEHLMHRGPTPAIENEKPLTGEALVPTKSSPAVQPSRSEALTLLAALQREARFVDIIREPLEEYSDAQIGAAARDVLKNSSVVIERLFGLVALTDAGEGSLLTTPAKFDPAQFHLIGNVTGNPPFKGTVTHAGWKATRCDVPRWSGDSESTMIVAPVELEVNGNA